MLGEATSTTARAAYESASNDIAHQVPPMLQSSALMKAVV